MTGGYTIIPLRSPTNEEVNITTTSANIKVGTFNKIKHGFELQKKIVLQNIRFLGKNYSATPIMFNLATNNLVFYFYLRDISSNILYYVAITNTDTILAVAVS